MRVPVRRQLVPGYDGHCHGSRTDRRGGPHARQPQARRLFLERQVAAGSARVSVVLARLQIAQSGGRASHLVALANPHLRSRPAARCARLPLDQEAPPPQQHHLCLRQCRPRRHRPQSGRCSHPRVRCEQFRRRHRQSEAWRSSALVVKREESSADVKPTDKSSKRSSSGPSPAGPSRTPARSLEKGRARRDRSTRPENSHIPTGFHISKLYMCGNQNLPTVRVGGETVTQCKPHCKQRPRCGRCRSECVAPRLDTTKPGRTNISWRRRVRSA